MTLGAVDAARRRGIIGPDDEVVALLTGNGLKTPDARLFGLDANGSSAAQTGLTPPIRPSLDAFEEWLSSGAWSREPVGALA